MSSVRQFWWPCAAACTIALLLQACGGGSGSTAPPVAAPTPPVTTPTTPPVASNTPFSDGNAYSNARTASLATPNEQAAVVHTHMTLAGQQIDYTATSGHLTATDLKGSASASFFYVAY